MSKPKILPNDKPFPVVLGEMKPVLQREAAEKEWSLSQLLRKIIKGYYEQIKHKYPPKTQL